MGTLKDVVDLTKELIERTENRAFAADLLEIQSMIGEIQSEQARIQEQNIQLMEENVELKQTIDSLKEKVETLEQQIDSPHATNSTPIEPLSDQEKQILKYLVEAESEMAELGDISRALSLNQAKTTYWLDKLTDRKMPSLALSLGGPSMFYLSRGGRDYLMENDLL